MANDSCERLLYDWLRLGTGPEDRRMVKGPVDGTVDSRVDGEGPVAKTTEVSPRGSHLSEGDANVGTP